jgi:hypothetical protein
MIKMVVVGDPYGHPTHCYKGKSLLFNHGDLEGESRLEMMGSTSSIRIRTQTKKKNQILHVISSEAPIILL